MNAKPSAMMQNHLLSIEFDYTPQISSVHRSDHELGGLSQPPIVKVHVARQMYIPTNPSGIISG